MIKLVKQTLINRHGNFYNEPELVKTVDVISSEQGYFLTDSELEQLARVSWNHGVADYRHYTECGDRNTFEDYWQAKKKEIEK